MKSNVLKERTFGGGGTTNVILALEGQAAPPLPPLFPTDTSPYDISPNNKEPGVASWNNNSTHSNK